MAQQKFNFPSGFIPYFGVGPSAQEDATGALFIAAEGRYGKDGWFGMHVFRQVGDGAAEPVALPIAMEGRGSLAADGYLTASDNETGKGWRVQVPGFVAKTATNPGPVVLPAPLSGVDLEARDSARRALDLSQRAMDEAKKARAEAQAAGKTGGISRDEAWQLIKDCIYAELQNPQSPLMATIWQKGKDAAYAFCKERGLIKS